MRLHDSAGERQIHAQAGGRPPKPGETLAGSAHRFTDLVRGRQNDPQFRRCRRIHDPDAQWPFAVKLVEGDDSHETHKSSADKRESADDLVVFRLYPDIDGTLPFTDWKSAAFCQHLTE